MSLVEVSVFKPLSFKSITNSAGSFDIAALRASGVFPNTESAHQSSCCGGTLAVEMTRKVGSTSHKAMNRRWPGLVGSSKRKDETLC